MRVSLAACVCLQLRQCVEACLEEVEQNSAAPVVCKLVFYAVFFLLFNKAPASRPSFLKVAVNYLPVYPPIGAMFIVSFIYFLEGKQYTLGIECCLSVTSSNIDFYLVGKMTLNWFLTNFVPSQLGITISMSNETNPLGTGKVSMVFLPWLGYCVLVAYYLFHWAVGVGMQLLVRLDILSMNVITIFLYFTRCFSSLSWSHCIGDRTPFRWLRAVLCTQQWHYLQLCLPKATGIPQEPWQGGLCCGMSWVGL